MFSKLKVVFMGTPDFSVPVLRKLIEYCDVIGVVTQPDKVIGRGDKVSYSPVKKEALVFNIPVLQPEKIRKEYQQILDLKPNIIITCAYGQIIPEEILNYPEYGCINVHASLLPKLRGGAPIHHAILDDYSETGITIMYMDKGMDTGNIISQRKIKILDTFNVGKLHDKLSEMGADLLIETLPSIIKGNNVSIPQNESEVTFGYNIKREEEELDFNKDCRTIFNHIRGLNPFPGAYFKLDGITYKIYDSEYKVCKDYKNSKCGEIVEFDKNNFTIKCLNGLIYIKELKKEGKRQMLIKDYLNGEKDNLINKVITKE